MSSPIVIDTRAFPIVYVAYPQPFTNADWNDSLAVFDTLLDRRVPFAWINDARTRHLPNAANRSALAKHQRDRSGDYRRFVAGVATVASSAVVRGIITAVEWVNPAPFPHATCSTVAEAERFVRARLRLPQEPLTVAGKLER